MITNTERKKLDNISVFSAVIPFVFLNVYRKYGYFDF